MQKHDMVTIRRNLILANPQNYSQEEIAWANSPRTIALANDDYEEVKRLDAELSKT